MATKLEKLLRQLMDELDAHTYLIRARLKEALKEAEKPLPKSCVIDVVVLGDFGLQDDSLNAVSNGHVDSSIVKLLNVRQLAALICRMRQASLLLEIESSYMDKQPVLGDVQFRIKMNKVLLREADAEILANSNQNKRSNYSSSWSSFGSAGKSIHSRSFK